MVQEGEIYFDDGSYLEDHVCEECGEFFDEEIFGLCKECKNQNLRETLVVSWGCE